MTATNFTLCLAFTLAFLCAGTARAQIFFDNWTHPRTGDPDLDRAVAICDEPGRSVHSNTIPDFPLWSPGYESCAAVISAWEKSDAARRQREAKDKAEADRAWLDSYAKGLKP